MAHPQLSSLQPLLILKVTVLRFICSIVSTFCQFVILVGDSGGNVSQVRTTWFLSWKLSIFFLTWAHLPTLYIALELTFLPRALSIFLLRLYCSIRWSIALYFAVPWCTVVHCYCPMMSCIEVLGSIVFWRIALPCNTSCMVGWCITFNITFYCLLLYCIYTLYCIALYCLLMY